jgi:hypothetical protein
MVGLEVIIAAASPEADKHWIPRGNTANLPVIGRDTQLLTGIFVGPSPLGFPRQLVTLLGPRSSKSDNGLYLKRLSITATSKFVCLAKPGLRRKLWP